MLLLEVLCVDCCSGDGVLDGLKMDLTMDGKDIIDAPKESYSKHRCIQV